MTYLKSLVVGLIAAASAAVLSLCGLALYFVLAALSSHAGSETDAIGWDPISLFENPPAWLLVFVIAAFVGGALWEFRRASQRTGRTFGARIFVDREHPP